ncbi:apolipoprotein N-acyltransferase [Paramagnetospirillum magneticum]|uniref:Apolipoprotein N-acyltransferase n=1 Tax=Paramagnetospirillum magneticum (strain ATCC 700264 / AMB-1) TaxID=342108 RepID=Q2VYQ4_PARM1|nr:apolipoprotein N-acyltransferase [Paramagnetospirillum magneticum]BAE53271.1 Apolipoprotein N-acyltransferase [Paramagnetospirillum magneticum AMB-1]
MTLEALAARFQALAGWRRRLSLMGLGIVAASALPPTHVLPVLLIAFPAMAWSLDAATTRRAAFGAGFWWSTGWFAVGLYWISNALLVDAIRFGWMIPFAVFGLSSLLAAFNGLATLAVHLMRLGRIARIPALAAALTLSEWQRSWVMTGLPWNPVGSVWDVSLPVLQFGALGGIWGLSLLTYLVVLAPALLSAPGNRRTVAALTLGLPAALWIGGTLRLAQNPEATVPEIRLRLVQAAVPQANKWRDDQREAHLRDHIALSRGSGFEAISVMIWPETAVSYFLDLDRLHRQMVAAAVPPGGLLLTGAPRITPRGVEPFQIWNSLMAVTGSAEIAAIYDKVHLVPFGEYVPMRAILPIDKITHGSTDFSAGPGPVTLDLPGIPPLAPLICYEAIFPGAFIARDQPRPGWIVNVTNDGWFGLSSGPHQHLAAARMRSIEEGLPQARAANTGISAVIDPVGRLTALLPTGRAGRP